MTDRISPHFTRAELACKGTGRIAFAPGFIPALEYLREAYDSPMIVTSGCRAASYNKQIGGHSRSLHMIANPHWGCDTCAIDIARPSGPDLHRLVHLATTMGWAIGIDDTFVHLDLRKKIIGLEPVIFTYD